MKLSIKDLPSIIEYLKKESENPTYPDSFKLVFDDLKNDYIQFVYNTRSKENEESLRASYEEHLAERGLSANNGDNMDDFDDYCYDDFLSQLSSEKEVELYDKVVQAVELHTFSI